MRRILVVLATAATIGTALATARPGRPVSTETAQSRGRTSVAQQIVIRGGRLFTGVADSRVRNTGIVIVNGKFAEVGANLAGRDLSAALVIDVADDETILPGMFDLHAHHNMNLVGGGRVDE